MNRLRRAGGTDTRSHARAQTRTHTHSQEPGPGGGPPDSAPGATVRTRLLAAARTVLQACATALLLGAAGAGASAQPASAPASAAELPLFAVEIKVGPKWDPARPPQDQAFFREHSSNLRRLREAGVLVMGARYADKGLVIVAAATASEVRAQMDLDPSMSAGTFAYEVHPFNVFYGGEVKTRPRR